MKKNELIRERIQNLVDAMNFKEPKKVPVSMEVLTWPFTYRGGTFRDVIDDPVRAAKVYTEFLDDVEIDIFALFPTVPYPVKAYEAIGSKEYFLSDDGTCIQHNQVSGNYMTEEDYDELINDYHTFRNVTMMRKKYEIFLKPRAKAYAAIKEAAIELEKHTVMTSLIYRDIEQRGIPLMTPFHGLVRYNNPLNLLFDNVRGIKNTLLDLRRRPDTVKKALQVIEENEPQIPPDPKAEDFIDKPYPLGFTGYHVECFLSPAQYDEYYFDAFKKRFLPLMEAGLKVLLKGEGKFLNTVDRFRQLPKGAMLIYIDEDDPFEMHKAIGDWATIGCGVNSALLKHGTKQECIDYAKRCFDTFAPGGGFVFMPNKPLIAANDANPENLRAVYEFANEYGRK